MKDSKRKVLIITYYWPPSGGAGVQRWLKFAKYLPEFGWEPVIYTPLNPEAPAIDASLERDVDEKLRIIRRPIFEPYSFYKKFTGKKGAINAGFLTEDASGKKTFKEKVSIWIRGNLFIPDARVFWVRPSIRYLSKIIRSEGIETIVSTGPPHSMHLIALGLKKRHKIRWIADFRDPWTNIDFYKDLMLTSFADGLHKKLEKRTLQLADEVICIGQTMAKEFEKISGRNIHVVTNGFDDEDFTHTDSNDITKDQFVILHLGSVNKDRNHQVFFKSISDLCVEKKDFNDKLKLIFVGKLDFVVIEDIEKFGLKDKTEIVSYVPHNEVSRYLEKADILYLPFNNTPNSKGVLTGKFFEYLAARKPIAAIGNIDGDANQILRATKAGRMADFYDYKTFKNIISDFFDKQFPDFNLLEVRKYSRKNLTKLLSSILE